MSAFIEAERSRFGVEPICTAVGVSASAYYQRRSGQRSPRAVGDERLLGRIREVQRDFRAWRLDQLWVADLSYLRCWDGLVYFAFIIDCFSRMVVGWQLAAHMRTDLVLDALKMRSGCAAPAPTSSLCTTQTAARVHEHRLHADARRPCRVRLGRLGRRRL